MAKTTFSQFCHKLLKSGRICAKMFVDCLPRLLIWPLDLFWPIAISELLIVGHAAKYFMDDSNFFITVNKPKISDPSKPLSVSRFFGFNPESFKVLETQSEKIEDTIF